MPEIVPPQKNRPFYLAVECYRVGEKPCLEVRFPDIHVDLKITPIPPTEAREQIILEQLRIYSEQRALELETRDQVTNALEYKQ